MRRTNRAQAGAQPHMHNGHSVESRADRLAFARDAGLGRFSFVSVLCGTLVAYGSFAVLTAIAGGLLAATGTDPSDLSRNDLRQLTLGSAIVVGFVAFLAYVFGGYCAGRMARRGGALNGFFVFFLGAVLAAAVGIAVGTQANTEAIVDNLRSMGMPTSGTEWMNIGTIAGVAVLLAMLLGSVMGGSLGERWHGKVARRAADPTIGHAVVDADDRTVDLRRRERPMPTEATTNTATPTDDDMIVPGRR